MSRSIRALSALVTIFAVILGGVSLSASHTAVAFAEDFATSPLLPTSVANTLTTNYAVPTGALFVSPTGSDANAGTQAAPFKTINVAISKVKSGGTLVVRGGVYREGAAGYATGGTNYVIRPTNITVQAYPGETPWMDGTVAVTSWTKVASDDYKVAWSTPSYCAGSYYTRNFASQTSTGPCSYSDAIGGSASLGDPQMVFVNGAEIKEVASAAQLTSTTFYYDWSAKEVHLGFDPAGKTVEVTKYPQALALYKPSNVAIKGIGIRRYASNQYGNATGGALLLNNGSKVTLDHVVLTQNAGMGLLSWNTNTLTVRSSWLSSNGFNGMNFAGSAQKLATTPSVRDDLVVEYTHVDANNADGYSMNCTYSCGASGFKGAGIVGANFRFNSFSNNGGKRASGVWCDLDCVGVNIYGNQVIGNAGNGIVYEVSDKGIIASNLIKDNGWNTVADWSYGIMMGSANTKIYNNELTNNKLGAHLYDDSRSPGSGTGLDSGRVGPNSVNVSMVNNVITGGAASTYTLVVTGGISTVAGNTTADQLMATLDHNSYAAPSSCRFVTWRSNSDKSALSFSTIEALRTSKNKELRGSLIAGTTAPAAATGAALPSDVASLLGKASGAVLPRGLISLGGPATPTATATPTTAATARDAFARTVAAGWGTADVGGAWTVESGDAMSVDGSSAVDTISTVVTSRSALLNSVAARDVSILTDFTLNKTPVGGHYYRQVLARVSGNSWYMLSARVESTGTLLVYVSKVSYGTETALFTKAISGFNYTAGEKVLMRFKVSGNGTASTLEGKVWRASQTEPTTPQVTATDTTASLQSTGAVGVKSYVGKGMTSLPLTIKAADFTAA